MTISELYMLTCFGWLSTEVACLPTKSCVPLPTIWTSLTSSTSSCTWPTTMPPGTHARSVSSQQCSPVSKFCYAGRLHWTKTGPVRYRDLGDSLVARVGALASAVISESLFHPWRTFDGGGDDPSLGMGFFWTETCWFLFFLYHCHCGRGHVGGDVLVSCGDVAEQWMSLHSAVDSLELKLDFSSISTLAVTAEAMMVVII